MLHKPVIEVEAEKCQLHNSKMACTATQARKVDLKATYLRSICLPY